MDGADAVVVAAGGDRALSSGSARGGWANLSGATTSIPPEPSSSLMAAGSSVDDKWAFGTALLSVVILRTPGADIRRFKCNESAAAQLSGAAEAWFEAQA